MELPIKEYSSRDIPSGFFVDGADAFLCSGCDPGPALEIDKILRTSAALACMAMESRNARDLPGFGQMLRRVWKPITASIVIGAPAYLYFTSRRQNFDIAVTVKGADGQREKQMKTLPLLSVKEVESRLSEHVASNTESRPGGLVWKHTTAFLPSNDPIEDANCHQLIQRDDATGDYLFFAVMDGHSGTDTSRLLSKTIIKATALQLAALAIPEKPGLFQSLWSSPKPRADSDPKQVALAIQRAFENLDAEIVKAPVRIVTEAMDEQSRKQNQIPDVSQHSLALPSILPALSGISLLIASLLSLILLGSCALMAVFDTAHHDLYVACTGDSRAVAGVWEPTSDGKGIWRVDVLSEDQTGRNPKELARYATGLSWTTLIINRMQSEHPKEEADSVIRNGRVLGSLEPSRAFGDARYKWPQEIQAM